MAHQDYFTHYDDAGPNRDITSLIFGPLATSPKLFHDHDALTLKESLGVADHFKNFCTPKTTP